MTYIPSCLPRVVYPYRMATTVLALLLSLVVLPGLLSGQLTEPVKTYSIPADDAAQSLKRFVEQAGVQLLYANEQVAGVRTQAVEGEFTATGALERLLRDTGLEVTRHERTGALAVKRAGDPNGTRAMAATSQRPERNSTRVSEDGTLVLEEVEVVESRMDGIINQGVIPTTPDAPFYFDIITRLDIERMGATNIEEVFRNTNQITTYSTANQEASVVQLVGPNNLATNAGMRGFDALQTTVLINGRRIARGAVPGLVGAASGDLSRIPVNAIERIEILPLSGSAMYGGGAIGGVINVILRKNYSGRELTTRFGTSTGGGSTEFSVAYLHGFSLNDGRTSGTFSVNYRERGALSMYERRNLLERAVERLPIETQISNFTSMPGVIRRSGAGDLGIPGAPGVRYATVPAGLSPAQANSLTPGSFVPTAGVFVPSFDRYKDNFIYTPMDSLSGRVQGSE
jgi:iron complex outermembrane recepter protein